MRRFYLHVRNGGIIYAELVDPQTGRKLSARSTGTKNRDEALIVIAEWLKSGIPTGRLRKPRTLEAAAGIEGILRAIRKTDLSQDDAMKIVTALKNRELIDISAVKTGKGSVLFTEFLEHFWNYEKSPYIKAKLAHGHSMGRRHCYEMQCRIHSFYDGYFKGRPLNGITREEMRDFSLFLTEKREKPEGYKGKFAEKLSASYVNKIMIAGTTALSWAYREGIIPADPTEGLMRFSGTPQKRGVLSPEEAEAVFKAGWKDKRAYAGNLLAMTTGLRAGEILALRLEDIQERAINVRHSWSAYDGLKPPKNGETRKVPLLKGVREELLELAQENPHGMEGFLFYGSLADKPMDNKVLLKGLQEACKAVGIDCKAREICVHGWRHFYSARMADLMAADKIRRITGHRSQSVFEAYADHITEQNLEEVGKVSSEVFGKILPFRKVV